MPVATYSLLENHDDVVVYRIPDPTDRTYAYIEVGLFPWQLEGATSEAVQKSWLTGNEPEETIIEGIGLRLDFHGPTRYHPTPTNIDEWMKATFDVFSRGNGQSGKTYRLQETTAAELRETARSIAQYAHAYWWALTHSETFTPGVRRDETSLERKKRLDIIERVHNDGTVIYNDSSTTESPYSIDTIELIEQSQWKTPTEQCLDAFDTLTKTLLDEYPEQAVWNGYHNTDTDQIFSETTETETVTKKRELKNALQDIDGIGRQYRFRIVDEFETLESLCEDIRNGSPELRSLSGIGEAKEEAIVDALTDSAAWIPAK